MEREILIGELKKKPVPEIYVNRVREDPSLIPDLLDVAATDKTAVRYHAEKIIRKISEDNPALLYPFFDRMAQFLDSGNNFIKWGFILTLPNMLRADIDNKWKTIHVRYLAFLTSDSIAAFGNAVLSMPKILEAHREYEKDVVPVLLNINSHVFFNKGVPSPECLNVAKGHIIDCFKRIYEESAYQTEIAVFVRTCAGNERSQVRTKAKKFLKEYGL